MWNEAKINERAFRNNTNFICRHVSIRVRRGDLYTDNCETHEYIEWNERNSIQIFVLIVIC